MENTGRPQVYENPEHYQLAFSFRDIAHEVAIIEECIRRYSRIPVRRVLELGCGPSPHMLELCKKGYEYIGLDLSEQMLAYCRPRAAKLGVSPAFVRGDMLRFTVRAPAEFAFILLGSLYARDSEGLTSHFESVAKAVRPGGYIFWIGVYRPIALVRRREWQ